MLNGFLYLLKKSSNNAAENALLLLFSISLVFIFQILPQHSSSEPQNISRARAEKRLNNHMFGKTQFKSSKCTAITAFVASTKRQTKIDGAFAKVSLKSETALGSTISSMIEAIKRTVTMFFFTTSSFLKFV